MVMESWSSDLVEQWLANIGLGRFSAVLNADKPFTGKELEYTSVEELGRVYKIAKRPAKKIVKERNNALAYLHVKPARKRTQDVEISPPFQVVHVVHVEFVPGRGLKGLPKEWKRTLRSESCSLITKKRESPKRPRTESLYNFSVDEVIRWSNAQVVHWLELVNMAYFKHEFQMAGIDGRVLLSASYTELATMLCIGNDTLSQRLFQQIATLRGTNKRCKPQVDLSENNNLQYKDIEIRKYSF